MSHRFFSHEHLDASQIRITDDQAHHLINVMRYQVGQEVTVFDGSGVEASAKIVEMNKREVTVQIEERREVDRELAVNLVVAVSLPKGDRQKFLVEKLTEIGVKNLIPLKTERSVALPSPRALERLNKSVIAASKQCERNRLMKIEPETKFSKLVADAKFASFQKLIATTHGESVPIAEVTAAQDYLMVIGPEGGFSANENEQAADNGFTAVRLGPSILRTETAAVVAASLLGLGRS
jgi:16S rRNA (uracil1498-N3)-methyltransferase